MQLSDDGGKVRKIKSSTICLLFILTSLSAGIGGVNAVGANQNDFYQWWGNGFGDLPDDINQIQNMSPLFPVQFMSPYYSGIMTAELDVNDDQDWFSFMVGGSFNANLGTYEATEELDVQITYSSTYTSPSNGTVYNNDFQLNLYDWNMTLINTSSSNNPGFVSTSGTMATPGNCCGYYVQVIRNQGYGNYDTEFWLRTITSGNSGTKGQNDLGYGTDLPDTQSLATSGNFVSSLNRMSPFYTGVVRGQLDVGDDQDWVIVTLDANEGLEVEINYSPSFTSPINGTVYNNEFDLAIYDSNSNQIDYSYLNNPEIVTTNTSALPHGGTIYVQIIRYAGYGSYDLELWTWNTQSGGGGTSNQNDLGIPNFDLPDSFNLLQTSGFNPYSLNGAAPYYSGTLSAEFDAAGDNEDWFAVTLNNYEWFSIEINYNPSPVINGIGYTNQFELEIWDATGYNMINRSFMSTGTAYVSTNNSAPGASIHNGLVYIRIYSLQGYGQYDVEYWTWTSGTPHPSTYQNDTGITNYDLPNTDIQLSSDPNWPLAVNGLAPYSSGSIPAQLNPNDTQDWLSVTIDSNEAIAFEVVYNQVSVNNGVTYTNDLLLYLFDANGNLVDITNGINPAYVSMNASATGPSSHGNTVYLNIVQLSGYVDYDIQFWTWTTNSTQPQPSTNQNDLGITNYDLPDTMFLLQNDPYWPLAMNGQAPYTSLTAYGHLDSISSDIDIFSISLNQYESIAFEISYNSTTPCNTNATFLLNCASINLMDGNGNIIDSSNDGVVTMNNSATGPTSHGGVVYVMIMQASWTSVDYNIRFWTWMPGGTNANQNDFGYLNYDLPDTLIDLQSDPNWPSVIIGAAPISSGIINAEFDYYSGDNDDWMSFAISSLEGFALEISYNQYSYNTSGAVINDFSITMYDANFNIISASSGNNPEIVTTNNSAAGPGGHGGTIYIHIQRNSGMGTYDIQLWTWILSGGGGNTFTGAIPTMNNITNVSIEMVGLVIGNNYQYEYNELFTDQVNLTNVAVLNNYGPYSFTATATTETFNHSLPGPSIEGDYGVDVYLRDASGSLIGYGGDFIYYEMLEVETTSSNTGDIYASNLTIGAPYTIQWIVFSADAVEDFLSANPTASIDDALNASMVDGNLINFTANTATYTDQVSWNSPTTMDEHRFVAVLYPQGANFSFSTGNGYLGTHIDDFIPQLPSSIITSYSFSISAAINDFSVEGLDLIPGDLYYHQFRVEDSNGADINYSSITTTTATAQNMSFGTFYYQTPTVSGQFCLFSDLYDANFVQIVGDSVCLVYVFDDDSDGVPNESDLCPNTQPGSFVDSIGCAASQKDFDGDGYNDDIDDFPYDDTQWLDTDGDGFGDNINGNYPDAFPTDNTQWSDTDGDGYGDNLNGNYPDAFPLDATQWSDNDGDGYGDNSGGNNPDLWPADPSQWTDSDGDGYGDNPQGTAGDAFPFDGTQWNDWDNDGHGDNANGNNPDLFPNDGTQWADADGDGYGDNLNGNNADKFPSDPTQWFDSDGDGYGDNQQGNNPDAFPSDNTQWIDEDGDGYGDNQNGNYPDKFPQDSSQWQDNDFDGFGDNVNGNNPDLCLNTPLGEIVDANGCSTSQTDSDQDGVYDMNDGCANTPAGEYVNSNGCSETQLDDDRDGVANQFDLCSSTPLNAVVNSAGCANTQLDSDNDGINDSLDSCPATNPGSSVDGFGCAPNQRDMDADGVNDNLDVCPNTPISEIATNNGCSESQIDSDMDGVFNDVDQCPNTTLLDLNSDGEFDIDSVGCSPTQYDDDSDMIDNTLDLCPATPTDEQVNIDGCSNSQLDEDNDDIWNSNDLCFDTPPGQPVDQNGCSDEQKDDDQDGMMNSVDQCPNTPVGEIINDNGCSLTQLDTDNDGVNDLEDAFPFDSNESVDTDSDGVPDRLDAYPQDALRSKSEVGDKNNGFVFILAAIFTIGIIGALLLVRNKKPEETNALFSEASYEDKPTEDNMSHIYEAKELPAIDEKYPQEESQENQTWEEDGFYWSVAPDGTLSYFDEASQSWILYQN